MSDLNVAPFLATGPQSSNCLRELRPIGPGPGRCLLEDHFGAGPSPKPRPRVEDLSVRRHPGVADQTCHEYPLIWYIESEAERGAPVRDRVEWANHDPPQGRDRPWPAPAPMAAPRCAAGRGGCVALRTAKPWGFRWHLSMASLTYSLCRCDHNFGRSACKARGCNLSASALPSIARITMKFLDFQKIYPPMDLVFSRLNVYV
jgi:hypothetical protein